MDIGYRNNITITLQCGNTNHCLSVIQRRTMWKYQSLSTSGGRERRTRKGYIDFLIHGDVDYLWKFQSDIKEESQCCLWKFQSDSYG